MRERQPDGEVWVASNAGGSGYAFGVMGPPEPIGEATLHARVPPSLKRRFQLIARDRGWKQAQLTRELLERICDAYEQGKQTVRLP